MARFLYSLRVRLILVVLMVVIPWMGVTLYTASEENSREVAEVNDEAVHLTNIIALQESQILDAARQILIAIAHSPSVAKEDKAACDSFLTGLKKAHYQRYLNIGVAKPNGDVFCSALPLPRPVNIADRKYFRGAVETRRFSIGEYQVGRITGEPSINFGYPVEDEAGNIRGVAFVALGLNWLNRIEFAVESQLPEGAHVSKLDSNGIVLAHQPSREELIGAPFPIKSLRETILARGEGAVEAVDIDGKRQIFVFRPLSSQVYADKLYVVLGVPEESAFSEVNHIFARNVFLLGTVTLIVIALVWIGGDRLILRPVNALVDVTRRLREGDLSARSGIPHTQGELGHLSCAFDEMAESLQKREEERQRAVRALQESEEHILLITNSLPVLIAYVDSEERYRFNNKAYEDWFGIPGADIQGKHIREIVGEEAYRSIEGCVKSALAGQEVAYDSKLRSKEQERYVSGIYVPHRGERGGVLGFFALITDITERKLAEEQISRQLRYLAALRSIDMAITSSLDLRVTLSVFLEQVLGTLGADAASVLLLNPYTNTLEFAASRGFITDALHHTNLRLGEGHAGNAALERRMVYVLDLKENPGTFTRANLLANEGFVSYYGVPLVAKGKVMGVLEIFHRTALDHNEQWLDFLGALASQAAIAIDNSSMFKDLQRSNIELALAYETTIEGWSRALDYRDKETEGHSQRVTEMAVKICRAHGVSEQDIVHARRGALLHDIGKLGVPDGILLKPGKLTEHEWEVMKKHPVIAYELLLPIPFLRQAIDIPYCHHEKWDGTGYPRGLRGEEIPLAARIFSVVDVWDALCSDRPYRPAWPEEKALEYIKELAGKEFDPEVVEIFLRVLKDI